MLASLEQNIADANDIYLLSKKLATPTQKNYLLKGGVVVGFLTEV